MKLQTLLTDGIIVSTVSHMNHFETVTMGLPDYRDDIEARWSSEEEALAGHKAICEKLKTRMTGPSWRNFRVLART